MVRRFWCQREGLKISKDVDLGLGGLAGASHARQGGGTEGLGQDHGAL